MGQYIAPVIVVLNEVALGKSHSVAHRLPGYGNRGNGEIAGLTLKAFDPILRKDGFVEGVGAEDVLVVDLQCLLGIVIGGRELRYHSRPAVVEVGAKEAAIYAVVLKI